MWCYLSSSSSETNHIPLNRLLTLKPSHRNQPVECWTLTAERGHVGSLYMGNVSFSQCIHKTTTKCNRINGDVEPSESASEYVWALRSSFTLDGCNPSPSSSCYWDERGFKTLWRLVGKAPTAAIVFTAPSEEWVQLCWCEWHDVEDWIEWIALWGTVDCKVTSEL